MGRETACVSILTPRGRGAVATVAVAGGGAAAAVARFFRGVSGNAGDLPAGRPVYGRWDDGQWGVEEVVVCRRAPEAVDVHCHGGVAAARRIADGLVAAGCREVAWPEWAGRSEPNRLAAEARLALAAARTERTAAVLLDQYHGALAAAIAAAREALDRREPAAAADLLQGLLRFRRLGRHLTEPWHVVVAGAVNVGKSSLVNALLGYQRSVVFDEPGTTRDVVAAWTAVDGWPVELADTAGLRDSPDAIESAGVTLARHRLRTADAIILVCDVTKAWSAEDATLVTEWPQAIVVHSKCDLATEGFRDRPPGLATSAVTGAGIEPLVRCLAQTLVPDPAPPGAAVPFTPRQADAIQSAVEALAAGAWDTATKALSQCTGESCGDAADSGRVSTFQTATRL